MQQTPFLIYKEQSGFWADAESSMAEYFQMAFELLAGHHEREQSPQYRKTVNLMLFPEPKEFGLGYVGTGNRGAGTGRGFAKRMVKAMAIAIESGLSDLRHFEELSLLVDKVGRDRISDICCNLLKPAFIEYTQEICKSLGVPTEPVSVNHAVFDEKRQRWNEAEIWLPKNPITGAAVLLTPKRFLRELPSLDAEDWWSYVEPELREDLNLTISANLRKESIIALARRNPQLVRDWTENRESIEAHPYDVGRDPEGLHQWQRITRDSASVRPLSVTEVKTPEDLSKFMREVNRKFKLYIEEQGGWRLLHNEDTGKPRRELGLQLLYKGTVQSYCDAYNVTLDREIEFGRGPVDFVLTASPKVRLMLEIKKLQNGKFWNGLEDQLTSYLTSAECSHGWFLAVRYGDTPTQKLRALELRQRTAECASRTGFHLESTLIDARPKKSASTLDGTPLYVLPGLEDDEFGDED